MPGATGPAVATQASIPPLPFLAVQCDWQYGVGDPAEGPSPICTAKPPLHSSVRPPHLVLLPDTPLWYESRLDFAEATVLRIVGDDGVQLFVNGTRVPTLGCNLFRVPAGLGLVLTIRVVNNAQHGGLLRVERATYDAYLAWERARLQHERLWLLGRKLAAAPVSGLAAAQAVQAARNHPTEAKLEAAEDRIAAWPLLLTPAWLSDPAPGQVTIRWETDTPGAATVDWHIDGPGSAVTPRWLFTAHVTSGDGHFRATLSNLPPGARIAYRLRQGAAIYVGHAFRAPGAPGDFQFTVWGDSQAGWETLRRLLVHMETEPPDFTVGIGDLVDTGCQLEQWRGLFATIAPFAASRPFFLIPGNHDYDGYYDTFIPEHFRRFARAAQQPNYVAWTWHHARFVALDPNETFPISIRPGGAQHQWFQRELASPEWRSAAWRFVLIHQPCYSQGKPDAYEGDRRIRELLDPLAASAGIDFVVSGHTHDFERLKVTHSDGSCTHHVILGGGGAALTPAHGEPPRVAMDQLIRVHHFGRFRIAATQVALEVIGADGRCHDRLVVTKPTARRPSRP